MLKLRAIDHLVLRVRDIDAMRRFYCEVLGAEHLAWRPKLGMSHLRAGSAMIDLVVAGHGETPGEIARRFGAEGNGVSIYVTDPEGNVVELKGPSDGAPRPPA